MRRVICRFGAQSEHSFVPDVHRSRRHARAQQELPRGGTEWLPEDTCAGTLIHVARGVVSVDDLPHHRTFLLRAPHSFIAHRGPGG
jgi:hypothetical protein